MFEASGSKLFDSADKANNVLVNSRDSKVSRCGLANVEQKQLGDKYITTFGSQIDLQ